MNLTALEPRHARALRAFTDDFVAAGESRIPAFFLPMDVSIEHAVDTLRGWEVGRGVPEEFVPSTTRFLEADGQLFGVFNFRQRLTEALRGYGGHVGYSVAPSQRGRGYAKRLLREALLEAKRYGVERALLTCSPDNVASQAVIEACGGVLQDTHFDEALAREVCRFWVPNP